METTPDVYSIELAKMLALISQYEQSNLVYLKLISQGYAENKCFYGLSQNLYFMNDLEHSIYFLNKYMDKNPASEGSAEISEEDDEYIEFLDCGEDAYDGYEIVYPLEQQDMTERINQARGLMKSGLFESAAELLKKVPKGNIDYLFARNNLALCCFFLNDYANAKAYCDEILAEDNQNVFALCTLSAMYNYIGDSVNSKIYTARFLEVKTSDLSDLFKIATTLCELKEHSLALKYLKMILRQKEYDYNIMFLTALAYYNNKMTDEAINMFLELLKINDRDYAAKYYLKLIRRIIDDKDFERGYFQPLEYICQLPYGEILERLRKLRTIIASKQKFKENADSEWQSELCDWSFYISDIKIQQQVVKRLCENLSLKNEQFLRGKLIDPKVNAQLKRLILEKFIIYKIKTPYSLCLDYDVRNISPHLTEGKKFKQLYRAYAIAYSTLIVLSAEEIENDIFEAFLEISNSSEYNAEDFKSINTLAAIIAYKSKKVKLNKIKKNMCKIFKANLKTFENYLSKLKKNKGEQHGVNRLRPFI